MAQPKLSWTDVDSSNVQSVAYHEGSHSVCVRFHNGGLYSYKGPEMDVYVSLVHADSVGKYLNQAIKGFYPYFKWSDEQEMFSALEAEAQMTQLKG